MGDPSKKNLERTLFGAILVAGRVDLLARRVHRDPRILALFVQDEKTQVEARKPPIVEETLFDGVGLNPPKCFHTSIFRVHTGAELLDDKE